MAFCWRDTIHRCLCVTGTWQGGGPWMPCNGTCWRANAVEATIIVCVQCGVLSARQRLGFISLRETGQDRGWKLEHSWDSVSHTDMSNRRQRRDQRAVPPCTAVMCYEPSCMRGWNAPKALRKVFKGTVQQEIKSTLIMNVIFQPRHVLMFAPVASR